jgi:hypothetical protein
MLYWRTATPGKIVRFARARSKSACRRFFVGLTLALFAPSAGSAQRPKPNILIIVADDLGYPDRCGGEIATPNLDALAAGPQVHGPARRTDLFALSGDAAERDRQSRGWVRLDGGRSLAKSI